MVFQWQNFSTFTWACAWNNSISIFENTDQLFPEVPANKGVDYKVNRGVYDKSQRQYRLQYAPVPESAGGKVHEEPKDHSGKMEDKKDEDNTEKYLYCISFLSNIVTHEIPGSFNCCNDESIKKY